MTTETTATCEARVGFYKGEWAEMPLWCSASVGLTTWTDTSGQTRKACRHHLARLQNRFPERYVSEIDGGGLAAAKAERERKEVAIERISSLYDPEFDDEPEFDREGQPEFNGSFR